MLKVLLVCAAFSITFDMILATPHEREHGKFSSFPINSIKSETGFNRQGLTNRCAYFIASCLPFRMIKLIIICSLDWGHCYFRCRIGRLWCQRLCRLVERATIRHVSHGVWRAERRKLSLIIHALSYSLRFSTALVVWTTKMLCC